MELQHPLHQDHPLIPIDPNFDDDNERHYVCSGCNALVISGLIFICSDQQCKFVLRKSCAELLMEIMHSLHTQHPLTLLDTHDRCVSCDNCNDPVNGFVYQCSQCDYDLHVRCASLGNSCLKPASEEEEDHKHKFVMVKQSPFTSDACGRESKGKSYSCTSCQARVHPTCSYLPLLVKFYTHPCPLKLTFGHQLDKPVDADKEFCRTCYRTVNTKYQFYYCADCEYLADIRCAIGKCFRDYQFDFGTADTSSSVNYKDVGKINIQTWHEHGLVLCEDEPTTDHQILVCRACISEISSALFYECKERCGLTLHKSCANLYEKIYHPFHQHSLVLSGDVSSFCCSLCQLLCNGFRYYCEQEECGLYVYDINFVLRSALIRVDMTHPHRIRLIEEGKTGDKQCKGCSSSCDRIRYGCPDCDYNVCHRCVGLPTSAKHSWDEHPLVLTYESVPHEYGEYHCDQCERPRDLKHSFYHCAVCERDVHTKCMGLHNLDPTRKYSLPDYHHPDHAVTLVANPQFPPACSDCGFPCKDFYLHLRCAECDSYMHLNAHFVDENWKLQKWLLTYECIPIKDVEDFPTKAAIRAVVEWGYF